MKLLLTSDWHIDATTFGVPKLREEVLAYVKQVRRAIVEEQIDIVVVSGDMFDPGGMLSSQYAADIIIAFWDLAGASRTGILVAIPGNHDVIEVGRPLSTLTPVACALAIDRAPHVRVLIAEEPSVISHDGYAFLMLPYISRAWADAEDHGPGGFGSNMMLDLALESAAKFKAAGAKLIVVGHLTVPGAIIGSESVELSRGRDQDLPVARLSELRPDLVINGHYHRPQIVDVGPFSVVIPGSPLSFATDDAATNKGYVVVEI